MAKDQTPYYVAISGFQKSIRRGLVESAVKLGKLAWNLEPYRFYIRFYTVFFEECARDEKLLRELYEKPPRYKEFERMEFLIEKMASSNKKSNETVAFTHFIKNYLLPLPENLIESLKKHGVYERFQYIKNNFQEDEFNVYDHLGFPKEKEWILAVCERGYKIDREKLSVGIPFFYMGSQEFDIVNDCEKGEMLNDIIPMSALDRHTRPGKFVLNVLYKKMKISDILLDSFYEEVFINEGVCIRSRITYPVKFREIKWNRKKDIDVFNEKYGERLNSMRNWAWNNVYQEESEIFQALYEQV